MDMTYEWVGPQASVMRMEPLTGVPLEGDNAFDARRVTGYQLLVTTSGAGVLYIDPARIVAPEDRERIGFVRHNAVKNIWERVPSTVESDQRFRIASGGGGLYALTLNVLSESRYVDDAVSTFPGWFAAVQDRNSNLRQLANIPASVFEDIATGLSEARRRAVLDAIPLDLVHRTFRYEADGLDRVEGLVVKEEKMGQTNTLIVTEDLAELYYAQFTGIILLDRTRATLHRLESEGTIYVEGSVDGTLFQRALTGRWVNVFNDFDEIGLQFGLPRLDGEDNVTYRDRLKSLFTHPGNATRFGLLREVARRSGGFVTVKWTNPSKAFVVSNPNGRAYRHEDVTLDGQPVETEPMPDGGFVIKPTNSMTPHEVVFYYGGDSYTLGKERLDERGMATQEDMESYERWRQEAPVLYGGIRYGRQEWDMVNEESLLEIMSVTDNNMEGWD